MFSHFFINRPIFSSVISLLILLAGAVTALKLPVAQFPEIVPPVVSVTAAYPGADAETVAKMIAIPIEQQVNGVDKMIYMSSTCGSDGSYSLSVTFEVGTDPDTATMLVQNRVNLAAPQLPEDVTRLGIPVKKKSTNLLSLISITYLDSDSAKNEKTKTPDNATVKKQPVKAPNENIKTTENETDEQLVQSETALQKELYLSNYASIHLKDELARIPGVGEATLMDAKDFSMRVWLNPKKLAERGLSVQEILKIIKEQNVQIASGKIGGDPVPPGQVISLSVSTQGRLASVKEFENLIVRTDSEGRVLKLKDVADVQLGKYSYGIKSLFNGEPSATLAIYMTPGANATEVAKNVREKLKNELGAVLAADGLKYTVGYDSTVFIEASIDEVIETLIIAVILVIGVVYIFLQDWRAALIPTMTIPVSLVGCFFLMLLFNFSINTLTMFGLVLVIGIVVDDAIVVVENTQRILNEESLSPKEAAKKSMTQVSGPIVATTCVLCSVFIPTTFISGMTGQLYTQFALTIAGAVCISSLCALTISPALCAIFLRKEESEKRFFFFRWFNQGFNGFASFYSWNLHKIVRVPLIMLILWVGLVAALYWGMKVMPTGFIPNEDQGVVFLDIRLPDGASLERNEKITAKVLEIVNRETGDILDASIFIEGYSMLDGSCSSNVSLGVLTLKKWDERTHASQSAEAVSARLMKVLNQEIPGAVCFVFLPPPISGVGTSGGLEAQLLDKKGAGTMPLFNAANEMVAKGIESGKFKNISMTFRPNVPKYYLDMDREKAKKLGVSYDEFSAALRAYLGASYVNDFSDFDRVFRVVVQGNPESRKSIEQVLTLPLINNQGEKVPLRAVLKNGEAIEIAAPQSLTRFNLNPSTLMTGILNPGVSSGEGMKELETLAETLPSGFAVNWSGMSYQEKQVGSSVYVIFILSILFGFLVLAAQYESWSAPLIIMMAVPLGVSGAVLAVALRAFDINIYTQIGLILMVGLSAKNAILITEFARDNHLKEGMSILDSALQAGTLRLRPIMMTSFAFILGVVPLAIAAGAGANSRQAIGTAVCGGMLEETMIGILVTPVLFILLTNASESGMRFFNRLIGNNGQKNNVKTSVQEKITESRQNLENEYNSVQEKAIEIGQNSANEYNSMNGKNSAQEKAFETEQQDSVIKQDFSTNQNIASGQNLTGQKTEPEKTVSEKTVPKGKKSPKEKKPGNGKKGN